MDVTLTNRDGNNELLDLSSSKRDKHSKLKPISFSQNKHGVKPNREPENRIVYIGMDAKNTVQPADTPMQPDFAQVA